MTALLALPHRERLRAVLMLREGSGWRVGVGSIVSGKIDEDHGGFNSDRSAERAALRLADERDLIAVQA